MSEEQEAEIRERVMRHFNDAEKAALWMTTPNPMFGNIAPVTMIKAGRAQKVLQFIEDAEKER